MAKSNPGSVPVTAPPPHSATPRRDYWRAVLEKCRRSGLRQVEFCRRRGIAPGTLSFWKHMLAREDARVPHPSALVPVPARPPQRPAFVPVRVASPRAPRLEQPTESPTDVAGEIEIVMGSGRLVRIRGRVDVKALRQVIITLEAPRC